MTNPKYNTIFQQLACGNKEKHSNGGGENRTTTTKVYARGSLFHKIQENKGEFKPRVERLKDQLRNRSPNQDKIKRSWKKYTEELYRKDDRLL